MTRFTANAILLIMAGVWAYLSVIEGMVQPISDNFLQIGLLIAAGELGAAADIAGLIRRRKDAIPESQIPANK